MRLLFLAENNIHFILLYKLCVSFFLRVKHHKIASQAEEEEEDFTCMLHHMQSYKVYFYMKNKPNMTV